MGLYVRVHGDLMQSRLLPREEWPRLVGTLLGETWPHLPPTARVVVVENAQGDIVGCSALFQEWHQEGTWVADAYRGSIAVGRHLLRGMREQMQDVGTGTVYMMATTPETSALCRKFGPSLRLDADHYVVRVS